MRFWHTYWGYRLCSLLGHAKPIRLRDHEADCCTNHFYIGCQRCEAALNRS